MKRDGEHYARTLIVAEQNASQYSMGSELVCNQLKTGMQSLYCPARR